MTKRAVAIAVAMVMVVGLIELVNPGGVEAVPVSKSLTGSCTGADPDTNALLGALGGNVLAVGFTVNADVPKTLDPGQSGVPISFQWNVTLDTTLVNKAVGAGLSSLRIRNTRVDTAVAGPTSTTAVLGRPGDSVVNLAANTPAVIRQGPFTGTLENVGQSGVVTYKTGAIGFTITVSLGGERNLNIACNAPGLIASTPIKVPGSPDIVQPIEIPAAAGAAVPVNVLGQYVTAGRTPIVPSSLRVVDGPGSVQNGQLVVNAGGAPSANSVTFEVCGVPVKVADAVPGVSEVQHLSLDKNTDLLKKSLGFTLKFGDQETAPIWTATPNFLGVGFGGGPLAGGMPATKVANWSDQAGNYAIWTDPAFPSAAAVQAALTAVPAIGAGNAAVTQTAPGEYDITFLGTLAQKDVPAIAVGEYYSNLPQENLDSIIQAASALSAGSGGPTTTTTIPAGLTPNDYILQLILQGNVDEAGKVLSGQILGGIDVTATLAAITGLFPAKPALSEKTAGVDPVAEQFQELCSQGSVTVTVAAPPAPPAVVAAAATFAPAAVKAAPKSAKKCSVVKKKVRVRIKGTKRYRTVTKKVTVCKKAKVVKKKASKRKSSYKKSSKRKSSYKKSAKKKVVKKSAKKSSAKK